MPGTRALCLFLSTLFIASVLFHLLVLTGIIPGEIVWGGRIKTAEELMVFETVSLSLNLFFLLVVLQKGGFIHLPLGERPVNFILWIMVILFALNTVGNLFAVSKLERNLFTPLTLLTSLACFSLLRARR